MALILASSTRPDERLLFPGASATGTF